MVCQTVAVDGFTNQLFYMSRLWGFFCSSKSFYCVVVLLCAFSILAASEPCSVHGESSRLELEACRSYRGNSDTYFPDVYVGQSSSNSLSKKFVQEHGVDAVCADRNAFCFPSILPGFYSMENDYKPEVLDASNIQSGVRLSVGFHQERSNLSKSCGNFRLLGGKTITCSLFYQADDHELPCDGINIRSSQQRDVSSWRGPLLDDKTLNLKSGENIETVKSGFVNGLSRPQVEIKPSLLDWGEKHLYFPSLAFLTVQNLDSDSSLNVFDPYSTNSQFYPCNFSEMVLLPGEVASVCFVFLPTQLGLSSAQLVLQTSFGGFLIQAKGVAVNSPYGIKPLVGLDVSSTGRWRKNLSLINPFDETLFVNEMIAWISISSRNNSYLSKVICSVNSIGDASDYSMLSDNWLVIEGGDVDLPLIALRPHRNWELGPLETETIMELDLSYQSEGNLFGGISVQLLRSSKENIDTIMVPLEAKLSISSAFDEPEIPLPVSLEAIVPRDMSGPVAIALSMGNESPYLLSVLKVSEVGDVKEHFRIRYVEGIILFPSTITQVAVLTCAPDTQEVDMNCKLFLWINGTKNSRVEIPCEDVTRICSRHKVDSSVGYRQQPKDVDDTNLRQRSSGSSMQPPSEIKALDTREADELVLRNWKSQATASLMSILDDDEILFSTVQVGSHFSRWITVKNPSQEPIVVQLILNAGEIINQCRTPDSLLQPSSSSSLEGNKIIAPTRYGFSIAKNALTEAFVHPHGRTSLGPILFQPSNRCEWISSALIRNNLSGVEWLTLRGFGGLLSLSLLEESDPVRSLEFKFDLPALNFSLPDKLIYMEDRSHSCSQPLTKELYAKNTGDLPLQVRRIEVSGAECSLDGFSVHTCEGFSLKPGEVVKLEISYVTDFSAATVQRDLQLALATGILVVPMKASLPIYVLNFCRRSIFWARVKKSMFAILFAAFVLLLLLLFLFPNLLGFVPPEYLLKSGKCSISAPNPAVKSSHPHHNYKDSSKLSISPEMTGLVGSSVQEQACLLEPLGRYSESQADTNERENDDVDDQKKTNCMLNIRMGSILSSSSQPTSKAEESSDRPDASQTGNLRIKVGKESRKSRRKKKNSSAGMTLLFEVSSSQSGNSTPSSPLSPVTSVMPKRSRPPSPNVKESAESRNSFVHVATKGHEKNTCSNPYTKARVLEDEDSLKDGNKTWFSSTNENPNLAGRGVLLPSATFPSAGRAAIPSMCLSPILSSTSTIAPQARAPGSKMHNQKTTVMHEEKTEIKENFVYDIWGDYLFGHDFRDKFKVPTLSPRAIEENSESFFVRGPQTLVTDSQLQSVSSPRVG